jgi:RNA polymerase sigma-70 factor (ECF subfamily)
VNIPAANAFVEDLAQRHLDAAYNLGRWLLGNEQDAADAAHDAYVRAVRAAHTYAGGNARAWWLAIVRNCCLAKLAARKREAQQHLHLVQAQTQEPSGNTTEERIEANQRTALIAQRLRALPSEFREALVLREIEDLSYREIADVLSVPIGTVMSRLSRGRALLQRALDPSTGSGQTATAPERTHGL